MRRVLWALLAIIVVAAGIILGISGYAASSLTQFERVPIECNPADFGLGYVDVSFPSRDGLMLRGWWLEAGDDNPVIVVVHGSHPSSTKLLTEIGIVARGEAAQS